jgi:protein N-lysine methyltransferase METTL21D
MNIINTNSTYIITATRSEHGAGAAGAAHEQHVEQFVFLPFVGSNRSSHSASSNVRNHDDPRATGSIISSRYIMSQKTSRRQWAHDAVLSMILAVTASTTLLPRACWSSSSIMENNLDNSNGAFDGLQARSPYYAACQSGSLMAETAIPGAYEQVCMQLPVRIVPVTIPTVTSSSSSSSSSLRHTKTVELQMEQGSAAAGTTGLAVWNSSLLLSRLLSRLALMSSSSSSLSFLQNQNVLELGCGTGLVSLTVALLGASCVVATDGNPNVVTLAQRNIHANRDKLQLSLSSSGDISARQLSWGLMDALDYSDTTITAINWVIGSDLTYNAASWRILAETMATVLVPNNNNSFVLYLTLGHAGFNVNAEMNGFLTVAQEQGLQEVQPGDADWPFVGVGDNGSSSSSSSSSGSLSSLTSLLLQECINTPEERSIVDTTGGARVVLLRCKNRAGRRY